MAGLVEVLEVATDRHDSLVSIIKILQGWRNAVTHYRQGKDVYGTPYLIFMWHDNGRGQPLLTPMKEATAIADQIYAWLGEQTYGREPDHDGSNNKGWLVTNYGPCIKEEPNEYYDPKNKYGSKTNKTYDSSFYDVLCVRPRWIEYHK